MKSRSITILSTCLPAILAAVPAANAAIVYLDANTSNTQQRTGLDPETNAPIYGTFTPTADGAPNPGLDNLWRDRTGSTNLGLTTTSSSVSRYEASDAGTPNEDAPRLMTTITGLNPGSLVQAYAYFWGAPGANQPWGLSAGLVDTVAPLQHYVGTLNGTPPPGSILATQIGSLGIFSNQADITLVGNGTLTGGNQRLMQIGLGETTIGPDGNLRIFLDDFANVDNTVRRSTFDGVGYEIIPEPSSFLLGSLALAFLAHRRR